ncbi:hypothetical protein ASG54_18810 [Aureimonas sp. Leaf460]|nr:hypothetical protein ASG62_12350 [Aureimonas sp. Leaf427]KQT71552.1 hypothetical protein ASG54_18810 [Aureimonas sp. Leaf460]
MAEGIAEARTGLFRATLLFGSIAAALSLIIVPAADRHSREIAEQRATDDIVTGSITPSGAKPGPERYTVRRSVLKQESSGPCLLFPDGSQKGAC